MKGLKKRVADLEQANGGINWIMLSVHHTADGRIRYDGQVYADTAALREAKGIPQDTFVQFIHWNFDSVTDEKPSPCEENAAVENRPDEQETPQVPVGSAESTEGRPVPESAVFNPFMRPAGASQAQANTCHHASILVWGR